MFLAYQTGWSHSELMNMSIRDLFWWVNESIKLHNQLNKSDGT